MKSDKKFPILLIVSAALCALGYVLRSLTPELAGLCRHLGFIWIGYGVSALLLKLPKETRARTVCSLTRSILSYAAVLLSVYFGLRALGVDVTASLASVGVVTLIIGFGAQSLIEDVLTGIFLIAELTGGYDLFVPLMIVSVVSYLTINIFEPHSIYAIRLARRGQLITHDKDNAILTVLKLQSVIERDYKTVTTDMPFNKFVVTIAKSHRNIFPVVDANGKLLGVVSLDSVRLYMFRPELYRQYTVGQFMKDPPALLMVNDSLKIVAKKFEETGAWNLPVVDENKVYIGFISRSGLFTSYRETLLKFSQE